MIRFLKPLLDLLGEPSDVRHPLIEGCPLARMCPQCEGNRWTTYEDDGTGERGYKGQKRYLCMVCGYSPAENRWHSDWLWRSWGRINAKKNRPKVRRIDNDA